MLALAGHVGYYESVYRQLSRGLDADAATLRRLRWERPTLRGQPVDANVAPEATAALADLAPLNDAQRDALAERLHYGRTLSAQDQALVTKRQAVLERLRNATHHAWVQAELATERGAQMTVPPYPRAIDASLLLLAQASVGTPEECLRIAADVMRIGQDLVPGGPLEAASVSMRMTSLCVPVVVRCAARADVTTLRRAAHELHTLATHPPPTGSAIELNDIVTAMKVRALAALTNKPGPVQVLQTLRERPTLLQTLALYDDPTRFRQLSPDHYPDALDEWKREQDIRTRSTLPLVAADASGTLDFLRDDMRGQALLRELAVGMAVLAERAYHGKLPSEPPSLREAALCDPFRGKPLGFRIAADGSELVIWSVGEDLRDDLGSQEWSDAAPLDVTLRFPLGHLDESKLHKPL